MKKFFCALFLFAVFFMPKVFAEDSRIIPQCEQFDKESLGAAFAPDEDNHKDSIYFAQPNFFEMTSTENRIILTHYPTYQQTTEYTCGPAAALTVLYYYGNKNFDEKILCKEMKTQGYPIGTSPKNMVNFFKKIGWEVQSSLTSKNFAEYDDFKNFVWKNLELGRPIMIENVEIGGHWQVIIGLDTMGTESVMDDVLILANSYDTYDHNQDGYSVTAAEKFFYMWFDHFMLPKNQREQPFILAYPKK